MPPLPSKYSSPDLSCLCCCAGVLQAQSGRHVIGALQAATAGHQVRLSKPTRLLHTHSSSNMQQHNMAAPQTSTALQPYLYARRSVCRAQQCLLLVAAPKITHCSATGAPVIYAFSKQDNIHCWRPSSLQDHTLSKSSLLLLLLLGLGLHPTPSIITLLQQSLHPGLLQPSLLLLLLPAGTCCLTCAAPMCGPCSCGGRRRMLPT
jgi:hypothetical protein